MSLISSTIIKDIEAIQMSGLALLAMFITILGRMKRRTSADCSRRCYSSSAINPIPIIALSLLFIRHTTMVPEVLGTMNLSNVSRTYWDSQDKLQFEVSM